MGRITNGEDHPRRTSTLRATRPVVKIDSDEPAPSIGARIIGADTTAPGSPSPQT